MIDMRVSGPISAQRIRPAPRWGVYGAQLVVLVAAEDVPHAATLPPQQRDDAACLTLLMAQTLGGAEARSGAYAPLIEDDGPIFALSA